jgi:hypothetical protein
MGEANAIYEAMPLLMSDSAEREAANATTIGLQASSLAILIYSLY